MIKFCIFCCLKLTNEKKKLPLLIMFQKCIYFSGNFDTGNVQNNKSVFWRKPWITFWSQKWFLHFASCLIVCSDFPKVFRTDAEDFFFLKEILSFPRHRLKRPCSVAGSVSALCAFALHIASTMATLIWTSIFLWISVRSLSSGERSETCPHQEKPTSCEFISRNLCLEFVVEPKTWSQAKTSCEERGGKLLQELNSPAKVFLTRIIQERRFNNMTWWMGKRVRVENRNPDLSE